MKLPEYIFSFDVESIGIHGEGFAVGGGIYRLADNKPSDEFLYACHPSIAEGSSEDRQWVAEHCPVFKTTHRSTKELRSSFWAKWNDARARKAIMVADCSWPVEARFLIMCIQDYYERAYEGPYPLHDLSTLLLVAGIDPTGIFEREENELPKHNPLMDARQSARIFCNVFNSTHQPSFG